MILLALKVFKLYRRSTIIQKISILFISSMTFRFSVRYHFINCRFNSWTTGVNVKQTLIDKFVYNFDTLLTSCLVNLTLYIMFVSVSCMLVKSHKTGMFLLHGVIIIKNIRNGHLYFKPWWNKPGISMQQLASSWAMFNSLLSIHIS